MPHRSLRHRLGRRRGRVLGRLGRRERRARVRLHDEVPQELLLPVDFDRHLPLALALAPAHADQLETASEENRNRPRRKKELARNRSQKIFCDLGYGFAQKKLKIAREKTASSL